MNNPISIPEAFWAETPEQLLDTLQSNEQGLTSTEASQRIDTFGLNLIQAKKQVTPIKLFLNQFKSPIMLILIAAVVVSAIVRDLTDAVIILLIVLGSALLSFIQEYNASSAAEKLKQQVSVQANVVRDDQPQSIPSEQVVPGDIVMLSAGSLIPADGIVLEEKDFFVNQALLTGETFPAEKKPGSVPANASLSERTNTVYMGTNVRSGSARVLIVQTGPDTFFGHLSHRLTLRPPETEFESGIRRLGLLLTEIMLLLVLGIFFINVLFHKAIIDSLLFSIALAVGLTPQLLPAIININLSKGSQALAERGVIVRRLEAIENFGSMDTLCTDKTGTITEGVVKLDSALNINGQESAEIFRLAYTNAHYQTGLSNPLDEAILAKKDMNLDKVTKLDEVPYDFQRKRLSVLVHQNGENLLITKGALENVISVCSQFHDEQAFKSLDEKTMSGINERFASWSSQGYRVLGICTKTLPGEQECISRMDETEMTFTGFLLFFDPPKKDAQQTIHRLAELGVQLKIITGDNPMVAAHTAEAVGLNPGSILTGTQLDNMHDEALWNIAEQTVIFADVDPNQKERIILALKKTGHVVGYMGDGINDAPSLHSADVGISVENAVDVAKEAADFVLLRQDFSILEQGIIQGRKTFANTMKYIYMATSANFGNMFSMAIASLFLPFLPMLPKQILLINFLTDLPEMTIANDNVDPEMVERSHKWDIHSIRRFMLVFGPLSSVFDLITFVVLFLVLKADQSMFHTGWFIESVVSACLVVFVLRTRLPLLRSKPSRWMMAVTLGVIVTALILPYTPLAGIFGFTQLPVTSLLVIAGIVMGYIFSAELVKHWFFKTYRR